MTVLKTEEEVKNHPHGIALEEVELEALKDEAHQPQSTEHFSALKKCLSEAIATTLKLDHENEEHKQVIDSHVQNLERGYGGESRFYERFLLARKGNLNKASKLIKEMVKVRHEVLGDQMVSNATLTNNFYAPGIGEDEEAFYGIDRFWALDFWGFTKGRYVLVTGKLKDINPGEFIKKYKKDQIKRFYFHFMEKGNILNRLANSPPMKTTTVEEEPTRRIIEVYDFLGMSRKQFHIAGLRMLSDVLSVGQSCFPEHVEKTFLINTPWYFSAAWAVVSKVLDKATQEKITISRHGCEKELTEMLGSESLLPNLWEKIEKKVNQPAADVKPAETV